MDELFNAAISGNVSFFEEPTGKDFNLEQVTERGNSILHLAAKSGKVQFLKKVLDLQRSLLLLTNCNGDTALHIAARLGHLDMTELLITTCAKDQEAAEKFLLLRKGNLEGNTALHEAIRNNYYDIVKFLIREGPELASFTNNAGESPLFLAVDQGYFEIAHHIIDTVPNCFYGGRNNMNVSHAAVIRYQTSIFNYYTSTSKNFLRKILDKFPKAILEAGKNGWTPLHYAAYFGNTEVVKMFLENNISLAYKKDNEGTSALHISAMRGHGGVMRVLITKCPNTCELLDKKGRTALHLAVEHGKKNAVKILLQTLTFQDHINGQDEEGNTPLHVAAINERFRISMMLADDRRVEKLAVNKEGMSAADIIESRRKLSRSENKPTDDNNQRTEIGPQTRAPEWQNTLDRRSVSIASTCCPTAPPLSLKPSYSLNLKKEFMSKWLRRERLLTDSLEQVGQYNNTEDPEIDASIESMSNFNITAMTIITTITFAAALQLPGGYGSNGKAILKDNVAFKNLLNSVAVAFGTSAAAMFIHFLTAILTRYHSIVHAKVLLSSLLIEISILFMVAAFASGIKAVLDENSTTSKRAMYCFFIPVFLFSSFLAFHWGFLYSPRVRKLLGFM